MCGPIKILGIELRTFYPCAAQCHHVIEQKHLQVSTPFFRYTRNLVDAGNGKFNLMVLCWNEAQGSSIHSHANAHCFMKILDGSVSEQMFEWPSESEDESEMRSIGVNTYVRNQVAYINGKIL